MCSTELDSEVSLSASRAAINAILVRSAMDVLRASPEPFELCSAVGTHAHDFNSTTSLIAHLGFAGEQLRGCLVVLATASVVKATQAEDVRAYATTDAAVRDLLGEFANLIVGRLKTHLIKRGVVILLATPTTFSGRDLLVSQATSAEWHAMSCKDGAVFLRVDAEFCDGVVLSDEPGAEADRPMEDGEMLLF